MSMMMCTAILLGVLDFPVYMTRSHMHFWEIDDLVTHVGPLLSHCCPPSQVSLHLAAPAVIGT